MTSPTDNTTQAKELAKLAIDDLQTILNSNATKKVMQVIGVIANTACNRKEYEDIIYVTSQKSFWLIPKVLADRLKEGAANLAGKVATPSKQARVKKLADSGVVQCLTTPKIESFLKSADKQQYLDDEWLVNEEVNYRNYVLNVYMQALSVNTTYLKIPKKPAVEENTHPKIKQKLQELYDKLIKEHYQNLDCIDDVNNQSFGFEAEKERLRALKEQATKIAKEAGYVIQNGIIFTPEQMKIKALIDNYLKTEKKIQQYERLSTDSKYDVDIFQAIAEYKKYIDQYNAMKNDQYRIDQGASADITALIDANNNYLNSATSAVKAQIATIVELANYGIAVPEFALGNKDATQGIKKMHELRALEKKREEEANKLKGQFDLWYKATGSRAVPPLSIFDPYVAKIANLDQQIEQIRTEAEQLTDSLSPPMILFWDVKTFMPKEAEWLVKGNMPLREFTIASDKISNSKGLLSHLSLYDLVAKNTKFFGMLNAASEHIKNLNKDNDLFEGYLKENDGYQIEIKEEWYTEDKGTFKTEELFKYIDAKKLKVKSIDSQAQRDQWSQVLNAIIFNEAGMRHIMAFDNSLPAAFVRCLGGSKMAQASFETKGPEMGGLKGAGLELKLKVSPAHGQVDIFNFDFPKPSSPLAIKLPYYDYNGVPKELDLGEFYLNIRAKAWYFAGISLMLGATVELAGNTGVLALTVTDKATSNQKVATGANAKLDLFAGVEAGMKLTCKLMWKMPANLTTVDTVYQQALAKKSQALTQVFTILFKGEVKASISAGATVAGEFGIILKNGKLHAAFSLKAAWGFGGSYAATFEIDYRSIMNIVQIVCQALIDNDMQPLEWVEGDAQDYITKIGLLGLTFPNVAYWSFWSITKIQAFYDSIFYSGNGGIIGYYMTDPEYQQQFKTWFMNLPAKAIGPLLWALSTSPKAFTVKLNDTERKFNEDESLVLQQQAINLCLGWMTNHQDTPFSATIPNKAQTLFEASVRRMNVKGVLNLGNTANNEYCKNRFGVLQKLMEQKTVNLNLLENNIFELKQFRLSVQNLGCHIDSYCHVSSYYGTTYVPGGVYTYRKGQ